MTFSSNYLLEFVNNRRASRGMGDTYAALIKESVFKQAICPEHAPQRSQMTNNALPQNSYPLACPHPRHATEYYD